MNVANGKGLLYVNATMNNRTKLQFLIDTGACASILPSSIVHPTADSDVQLRDANGKLIRVFGQVCVNVLLRNLRRSFMWSFVVADIKDAIIGADFLRNFNLSVSLKKNTLIDENTGFSTGFYHNSETNFSINMVNPEIDAPECVKALFSKFSELATAPQFNLAPLHSTKHRIDTGNSKPICFKSRPLNAQQLQIVKSSFNDMLQSGIIQPSSSPWASPLHMVKKSDGTWRPVGDYRALNKVTVADKYPVPNIEHFTTNFSKDVSIFSKVDLVKAYHQIPMHEDDIAKTAIVTPFGSFEFLRMNFGLKNAGASFQRFIDEVVRGLDFVFVFVDDVIISSRNLEEHVKHLEILFQRFQKYGIRLSLHKCEFAKTKINFLGYQLSKDGIRPTEEKVKALCNICEPKDHKALRRLLGMFGFYQRFIVNYAQIVMPLRKLQLEADFNWTQEHSECLEKLKSCLCNAVTLSFPSSEASKFTITSDASHTSIGACLHQIVNGDSLPLAFYSRKLSDTEVKYSTFDKELLAIFAAVKKWSSILQGIPLTVFCDHKPIVGAFQSNSPRFSARQQRQLSVLSEYVSEIVHIAGSSNIVADSLSKDVNVIQNDIKPFDLESIAENQIKNPDYLTAFENKIVITLPSGKPLICDKSLISPRPIVPPDSQRAVFNSLHDLTHPSTKRSLKLIKERYTWSNIDRSIKQFCNECVFCQQAKITRHTKAALQPFPETTNRFSHIHLDLVGPLENANRNSVNYRYILTIIDRATKWIEAVPLVDKSAKTVAEAFFFHWISRFGSPLQVITDQGKEFNNSLFKELSKFIGFHHTRTTSYHPQSNGLLERQHRTIKQAIKAHILQEKSNWYDSLPVVLFGLRIQPLSNNYSPFEMVTGQKIHIPVTCLQKLSPFTENDVEKLAQRMQNFSYCTYLTDYKVKNFLPPDLMHCSHVWLRTDRILKPLEAPYSGPYPVSQRNDKTFTLRKLNGQEFVVSVDRLKPAKLCLKNSINDNNVSSSNPCQMSKQSVL